MAKEYFAPTLDDLLGIVKENYEKPDIDFIRRAHAFSARAHGDQRRMSGEPFVTHPTAVACMLADMRLGIKVIAAGLLHDVIEDTSVTFEDIKREFGVDIANLVESVSKLQQAHYRGQDRYIGNLRRMFLAMASDVRAILIKFADRLHNLQTLGALPVSEQKRIAHEALEIHAPIAGRLGMGEMKGDLEDTAFRYDNPEAYAVAQKLEAEKIAEYDEYVKRAILSTEKLLAKGACAPISVHGRVKRLYSFYKKLERYKHDITRVYDILAIRIIVPGGVEQCYATLGLLHQEYTPLPGRVKDYIAQPKPNGYQSLHTTVFCEDGRIVEFQIRTQEMHELAEYGIAAHWRYKEGGAKTSKDARWMRELETIRKEVLDNKDFLAKLEEWKLELFKDHIFVFTPKGDVIDLPDGATPVDFAYAVHTHLGHTCASAMINGNAARLNTSLVSGDVCEIVTDKNRKGPSLDWLKSVKTHQAREQIRKHARRTVPNWIKTVLSPRIHKK